MINTTVTIEKGCSIEQTGLTTVVTVGIINHIKYGRHYLEMTSRKLLERIEAELVDIYDTLESLLGKIGNHLEGLEELHEDLVDREAEDDYILNFKEEEDDEDTLWREGN